MTGPDQVSVLKNGADVLVQSAFSAEWDVIIKVGRGVNRQINFSQTRLVACGAELTEPVFNKGLLIHNCGDDSTPWNLNGTYIGANHGCSDARQVDCPKYGRTTADIGSAWTDSAGIIFYLVKIVGPDKLWFLSQNKSTGVIWQFTTSMAGAVLTDKVRSLTLAFSNCATAQLTPACRIKKQEYLADGKTPVEDGAAVTCGFFDIVEEYEIINPASLLEDIIRHPGVEPDFTAARLAAVVRNRIVYRFYPKGCTLVEHHSQALQNFQLGYMGFVQSAKLPQGAFGTHEYYIPKTRPFTQDGIAYNFNAIQDYSFKLPNPLRFAAACNNIADAANLPDRFIQLLGDKAGGKITRRVGFAMGYSLTQGMTQPAERARNTINAIMLYTTSKSYPSAADGKMGNPIRAGTEFHCTAYRQYFDPSAPAQATCVYWHPEGTNMVVYADYHRPVAHDRVKLPGAMTGKQITVREKTDSLTLHSGLTVPAQGIDLSVTNEYGRLVFIAK